MDHRRFRTKNTWPAHEWRVHETANLAQLIPQEAWTDEQPLPLL
jgi:hypothetical protein